MAKPNPEFFDRIIDAAGIPPDRIVYVGDRIDNDVIPARKAGMKTVLVRRGLWAEIQVENTQADASIDALTELPVVLDSWAITRSLEQVVRIGSPSHPVGVGVNTGTRRYRELRRRAYSRLMNAGANGR